MPRLAVRALVPPGARFMAQLQYTQVKDRGLAGALKWNRMVTEAWIRERFNRSRCRVLDESQLRAARKSDKVFIFGFRVLAQRSAPR